MTDLMYSSMSAEGQQIFPNQYYMVLQSMMTNNLLFCGNPHDEHFQVIFSGPHLMLRPGGKNREGVAFGGPQIYGDQSGDKQAGLPDNMYRLNLSVASALFDSLSQTDQLDAVIEESPIQTQIEVQGRTGEFSGIPIASVSEHSKSLVRKLIDLTFRPYQIDDAAYAWECIEANGGVNSLFLSYYADSSYDGSNRYQNYRLEGPSSVFYFRGFPHVHAFFNIAMDGDKPLSVGDVVGRNPTVLEGPRLKRLFEKAMQTEAKTDFAYYPSASVVGKIRPGTIRTGDLYNAESWIDETANVSVKGDELSGVFLEQLKDRGTSISPQRVYTIATTTYVAKDLIAESFGKAQIISDGPLLREQLIQYVHTHGFTV